MYPAVRELKEEMSGTLRFIVADVRTPQGQELAIQFWVRYIPDFVVVSADGTVKEGARHVGPLSRDGLRALIEAGLR